MVVVPAPEPPASWQEAWDTGKTSVLRSWFHANTGPTIPLSRTPILGLVEVYNQAQADALVGKEIRGSVAVRGNGIDFHDFKVVYDETYSPREASGGPAILLNVVGVRSGCTFHDIELGGSHSIHSLCLGGASYASGLDFRRIDIHGAGQDGIRLMNDGYYQHIYVHDQWKWVTERDGEYLPSADQRYYPHTDGAQAVRGGGLVEQCWIDNDGLNALNATSAIIINPDGEAIDGWTVQDSYLNGGGYAIHMHPAAYGMPRNVKILGNRFGRGSRFGLISAGNADPHENLTYEGNVWADTLLPVPVYPAPLTPITTPTIGDMQVGAPFSLQLEGGTGFAFDSGALPGIGLTAAGLLSGTPTISGAYTVTVKNSSGAKRTYTGTIAAGAGGLLFQDGFSRLDLSTDAVPATWRTRGLEDGGPLNKGYVDYAGSSWNVSPAQHPTLNPFTTGEQLTIQASRLREGGNPANIGYAEWTSGYLVTEPRSGGAWAGGYAEARIRYTPLRGGFPAFWLFRAENPAASDNKRSAEIDILEVFGEPDGSPWSRGWHKKPVPGTSAPLNLTATDTTDWHVYGVEWGDGQIRYWRDGVLLETVTDTWFDGLRMGVRINLAVDPSWLPQGDPNRSTPTDPSRAAGGPKLEVEWVRVWGAKP